MPPNPPLPVLLGNGAVLGFSSQFPSEKGTVLGDFFENRRRFPVIWFVVYAGDQVVIGEGETYRY